MKRALTHEAINKWHNQYFLLEPLGWLLNRLSNAIEGDLTLLESLVTIEPARMHLIAMALAHHSAVITCDIARKMLTDSTKAIVDFAIGRQSRGISRALRHLPAKVMMPDSYRDLIDLMNDSATAKFIHHCASIDEPTIGWLHRLPGTLRRAAIIKILARTEQAEGFVDGLQYLAERGNLRFDDVVKQLSFYDQAEQAVAYITQLIESLPLPDTLPPARIAEFHRVDSVAVIRILAKEWRNCLAEYLHTINNGTAAVYLSDDEAVVCYLCRYGRMGWFLLQAKGPENASIEPKRLSQTHDGFADCGIRPATIIECIRTIVLKREWSDRYEGPAIDGIFDEFE